MVQTSSIFWFSLPFIGLFMLLLETAAETNATHKKWRQIRGNSQNNPVSCTHADKFSENLPILLHLRTCGQGPKFKREITVCIKTAVDQ